MFTQPSQGALPQQTQSEAIPGFRTGADIKTLKGIRAAELPYKDLSTLLTFTEQIRAKFSLAFSDL